MMGSFFGYWTGLGSSWSLGELVKRRCSLYIIELGLSRDYRICKQLSIPLASQMISWTKKSFVYKPKRILLLSLCTSKPDQPGQSAKSTMAFMLPSFPLMPRLLRRLESSFSLQPVHDGSKRERALEAGVVGAGALLERENPVEQGESENLLQVFRPAAKVEWVFARLRLKDCKNMALFWWCRVSLGLWAGRRRLQWIGYRRECRRVGIEVVNKTVRYAYGQRPNSRAPAEILNCGQVEHGKLKSANGHSKGEYPKKAAPVVCQMKLIDSREAYSQSNADYPVWVDTTHLLEQSVRWHRGLSRNV